MNAKDFSPTTLAALHARKVEDGAASRRRFAEIEVAMTPEWKAGMARRVAAVVGEASSPRSKLPKVYSLLDEVGALRAPHVACKPGCDACCHMQIEITQDEADRIGQFTSRVPLKLRPIVQTTPISRLGRPGTPCPFLVDHACSIYEARPFVCRSMAVVDDTPITCSFENMALARANDPRTVGVPESKPGPLVDAFKRISEQRSQAIADIRQFFPTGA